jgi:hypothetical protein
MYMSNETNDVIKLVIATPGKTPDEVGIELGGTLEFRNHFKEFPLFEITFEGQPPSGNDTLTGTTHDPILVHMPTKSSTFRYSIQYKKEDGTCGPRELNRLAKTCPGC